MADGISIPGVTNKYNTTELVEQLMEVERVPLKREQTNLENYQKQLTAWNDVSKLMTTLREDVKKLYSFENPFSNRLASSSDEDAITVTADRNADFGSFKIDVVNPATADRFLSNDIDKNYDVPKGRYTFTVGDKTIDYNFKGGKLKDFVEGINKRGGSTLKASIIGISSKKSALLIESLKEGSENRLVFENDALTFAKDIGMLGDVEKDTTKFNASLSSLKDTTTQDEVVQNGMPSISKNNIRTQGDSIAVPPRGGFEMEIPKEVQDSDNIIEFTYSTSDTKDITQGTSNDEEFSSPQLPFAGGITFEGITIPNDESETTLPPSAAPKTEPAKLKSIDTDDIFYVKNSYGMYVQLEDQDFTQNEDGSTTVKFKANEYPSAQSLVVRNSNTGKEITMTVPQSYDASQDLGYKAKHAITEAGDAVIKYEGITITRGTNDIDDVVPNVTLHLHEKTEKTATIKIDPDTESAKDALITFVGNYNQVLAEMNILSSNKEEVINELDYLTSDEVESKKEKLGMFQGDFILTNGKSSLQNILATSYRYREQSQITMLSQIGISTNASSGYSGYSSSQMRGYLEINEDKLDEMLKTNLDDIKSLFGYDSDGDYIIDSGIGYLLDKQLTAWVQTGGILSNKISTINKNIETTNTKISKLEEQLDDKEAELKSKYASMEGSLDSLESQQSTITNFTNQNSGKN